MLSLPTLVVLFLVFVSTRWHRPTRIQAEVTTRRLAFVVGGDEPREILGSSVQFTSLVIEDCAEVSLAPERLEVANPSLFIPGAEPGQPGRYPESAWREIKVPGTMRFLCEDDAKVTLRPPREGAVLGALDRWWVEPGSRVVLEVPRGRGFEVAVQAEGEHSLSIPVYEDPVLVTDLVEFEGRSASSGDLLNYRTALGKTDRMVRLRGRDRGLTLIVLPAGNSVSELFSGQPIPLTEVELYEQGAGGRAQTSLVAEGKLSYPGFEKIPAVSLTQEELVGFGKLGVFQLESLGADTETGGLKVRLDGEAVREPFVIMMTILVKYVTSCHVRDIGCRPCQASCRRPVVQSR